MLSSSLAAAIAVLAAAGCMPPSWGAAALLHPSKTIASRSPRRAPEALAFDGEGVKLAGWRFRTAGQRRGTVIYLHGSGDNRGSSVGVADHFLPRGYDVVAYDSRAHGESEGDACTYGVYEKRDLARVIDQLGTNDAIIAVGASLGAAVALQAAADDRRISAVVAVATFSDLRSVAYERAPFFASSGNIEGAFRIAEASARFRIDDANPARAATRITVPVLLLHGERDQETPPSHSRRVYEALRGPKALLIVPNAGHGGVLRADTWPKVDDWLATALR